MQQTMGSGDHARRAKAALQPMMFAEHLLQDAQAAIGAALLRQLVRAELARRECFYKGRVPEFLGEPSEKLTAHLQALTLSREGDAVPGDPKLAELLQRIDAAKDLPIDEQTRLLEGIITLYEGQPWAEEARRRATEMLDRGK